MSIEDQIAALEARIEQCIILVSGATERAEEAASRAEIAASRAELAHTQAMEAATISTVAATSSTVAAEIAVAQEEEIEQMIEEVEEDASESLPDERGSGEERETAESENILDGEREAEVSPQPDVQPIVIEIKEPHHTERHLFKPNRTRFSRGRTA